MRKIPMAHETNRKRMAGLWIRAGWMSGGLFKAVPGEDGPGCLVWAGQLVPLAAARASRFASAATLEAVYKKPAGAGA